MVVVQNLADPIHIEFNTSDYEFKEARFILDFIGVHKVINIPKENIQISEHEITILNLKTLVPIESEEFTDNIGVLELLFNDFLHIKKALYVTPSKNNNELKLTII
ncbi:uncharacterized protein CMU_026300 [Cryptosporidium muris RN66]|uniref:Uncharacterized protein n=1 Tax=Cryptosporidium muris (strain RN66) TaxID=441375 RepID=B6AB71_CRYMR|nr:uncharacterized protein CMU_026300 [Cryptosporidium muris RN66]EEA05623.1 hypothetical protein CMU_026300 [Cryptosporidium muris RN66]|eukprot:XP_002139972.1 hypothetical protein [Cryptosporidium muris RN66]